MGYEAITLPATEAIHSHYTYETVGTLSPIRAAMEALLSCGIEQISLVSMKLIYDQDYRVSLAGHTSA